MEIKTPFALERAVRRAIIGGVLDNLDIAVQFNTTRLYVARLRSKVRRERAFILTFSAEGCDAR